MPIPKAVAKSPTATRRREGWAPRTPPLSDSCRCRQMTRIALCPRGPHDRGADGEWNCLMTVSASRNSQLDNGSGACDN